ncbi:hypothetical protein [Flavilitoribacter nigricans]|uniref:DUF2383 domain-containing protein n=1 Tax=Flavilitoribacter nigricans (strain ATCC 23147 / DSM 23189 / NBRC 102662 / NCIMB 1420 / SS-2) TaxID=1122177 RepID=A0A2D0NAE3_FLAN2|nr:hypothetical protein [Flavilitoribacter nigricans]PHN05348.1 hypothetical protein CRP01_17695 [Flavilitoribacter nigricans DSM 23189 = NBRC 102662]
MLFHLYSRHDAAASDYRQIVADLKDDNTLKNWFNSLAEFRQELANELRPLVEDNGSIPVKPSKEMRSYLHDRSDDIIEFINKENEVGLLELSLEAEESVGKYYQKIEANKDIPLEIREKLEKQHDRLLEVIEKAQRLQTVPEQDRSDFVV